MLEAFAAAGAAKKASDGPDGESCYFISRYSGHRSDVASRQAETAHSSSVSTARPGPSTGR